MMESTTIFGSNGSNTSHGTGQLNRTDENSDTSSRKTSELLSSLLIDDDSKANVAGGSDLFGSPIAEDVDADLFGSLERPAATNPPPVSKVAQVPPIGPEKVTQSPSSHSVPATDNLPIEAGSFLSKLSSSGLLGGSSGGLFGGSADSGSGLFDEVDAEEAEKERRRKQTVIQEEETKHRAAAAKLESNEGQQPMQDLNLSENNYGMYRPEASQLVTNLASSPPGVTASGLQKSQFPQSSYQTQPTQRPQQQQDVMNAMTGSYYYSTTGAGQMQGQSQATHRNGPPQPSVLAGMHVGHDVNLGGVSLSAPNTATSHGQRHTQGKNQFPQAPAALTDHVPPAPFDPLYGKVVVNDPMLIQGTGLFAGPPHWTYLVTVHSKHERSEPGSVNSADLSKPVSAVRRRFRHFVALEDRLRGSVPGAVLPPRPEKHPARAIEEATARQSAEFAMQRSQELTTYMNALVCHPHAGLSSELKLFLTLQDHIGTAWPEVSSSAFTRMTAVGSATVEKLSDTVDGMLQELGTAQQVAAGEDSAEILALAAFEGRRIGAVTSSVPKIEGAVSLIRERGDRLGATGLEMSKLAKDIGWCDKDMSRPMEVISSALLRCGRRTKRLGLELAAAISPFVIQYRTCRYEQMAFADRRAALKRRTEARNKADGRAAKLIMNQTSMQSMGRIGTLDKMEMEAAMLDEMATEASREADEIAIRLQNEVARVGAIRVKEWDSSMKVIASGMKEACAENAAIWESALESFKKEFPEMNIPNLLPTATPTPVIVSEA